MKQIAAPLKLITPGHHSDLFSQFPKPHNDVARI
jgi:hypothetical protein